MKYFIIGIKGSGTSSLACILHDLGNTVIGSGNDLSYSFVSDKLIERNIEIKLHNKDNIEKDMIVIYSTAVPADNVELVRAKELGLDIYTYPEFIGYLTNKYKTIAVSGCHGKTTTTSMLSHVFSNIVGCNYLIGDGHGHVDLNSDYFMLEACEYHRHFLNYNPYYTIVTNVELDHVDYFKDINDVCDAYKEFMNKTKNTIIAFGDDSNIRSIKTNKTILYYGFNENNDIYATNIEKNENGTSFDVIINNKLYKTYELPIFGDHIILNILAVITITYLENLDKEEVSKYLSTFNGAARRFQIENINGTVCVDDYAHHPTEIKATLSAIKQKYPNNKILSIFEIHTYSRAEYFKTEFIDALNLSDEVFITDIYDGGRGDINENVSKDIIVNMLNNGHAINNNDISEILNYKNHVIVYMSAGKNSLLSKIKENL